MIKTQMLHCLIAYTTDTEMSFSLLRRFPRNTDRTTNKIKVDITDLSFQILAQHRQDQRGHPRLELARLTACQLWQTSPPPFRMERRTFVYNRRIPYRLAKDKPLFRTLSLFWTSCANTEA